MHTETAPLVSVVVPNYNYSRYLKGRIESIFNQTYTDYELILLDDASTDRSVEELSRYKGHSKVSQIIVNDKNTGSPFQQWIKGIKLAKGKYVWIAEADDLAYPTLLSTCINYLESHEGAAFCYVGSQIIDAEGTVSDKDVNHWGRRSKKEYAYFNGQDFVKHNLYWKNYVINASGVVFRREYAVNLVQSTFQTMRYCGDWLFWVEMAMQGGVIEVYSNLNFFRMHQSKVTGKSKTTGEGLIEDMKVLRIIEERIHDVANYKRRLRRGLLYRKIKKGKYTPQREKQLFEKMEEILKARPADYRLERWNQVLRILIPTLTTHKRDRL